MAGGRFAGHSGGVNGGTLSLTRFAGQAESTGRETGRGAAHARGPLLFLTALLLAVLLPVLPACRGLRPDWAPAREVQVIDAANALSRSVDALVQRSLAPFGDDAIAQAHEVDWLLDHEVARAALRPGNKAGERQWTLLRQMVQRYVARWRDGGPVPADVAAVAGAQINAGLQSIKRLEMSRREAGK